ncbi:MAG TPA: hypothetical protein VJW73_16680 [Gemmatimonadaceae bacterium]|nr:hypothetical protein [Gemmatimonadaceae bacterium]
MPLLYFGSLTGSAVATALFGTIAVVTGWSVTAILRRFSARPGELPYIGTTPRVRRAIGSAVALGLLAFVWAWLWSGFYVLELRAGAFVASYYVPSRSRSLPQGDVVAAHWEAGPKSSRILVLVMRDGEEIRSTQTSLGRATEDRILAEVAGALGVRTACGPGMATQC